jgi:hypothetical protein
MAISGHKTLTEVQRYTADADRKVVADHGMAKKQGRTANIDVTNSGGPLHKLGPKALKTNG